ncbi:hypothetical protein, unlikely [Trypanosoma brucei gambiense DAL972]|uniref:Uncharacterized protein n=1 Tax=Trypanosoma brucei gambiense (strain MHOM/CI/86/DAL972) TaxID=679716 RepID=C9ZNB0_TRYB9|nr:hypothetical protein, unlikely [Trypanosoma brucei gambiense DAL972]CBH10888.1 hypothetical protein, unlikely [Trypanosoma brucei gambiense DAL972]|eukprot:XP_011773175.1 hypothetical protein, unlikely [Trypanosoma brucei gambiense DAL972]
MQLSDSTDVYRFRTSLTSNVHLLRTEVGDGQVPLRSAARIICLTLGAKSEGIFAFPHILSSLGSECRQSAGRIAANSGAKLLLVPSHGQDIIRDCKLLFECGCNTACYQYIWITQPPCARRTGNFCDVPFILVGPFGSTAMCCELLAVQWR